MVHIFNGSQTSLKIFAGNAPNFLAFSSGNVLDLLTYAFSQKYPQKKHKKIQQCHIMLWIVSPNCKAGHFICAQKSHSCVGCVASHIESSPKFLTTKLAGLPNSC